MFKIKFLLIISAVLIFSYVNSYSQTITFSAKDNKSGEKVNLDSVIIQNLALLSDTTLIGVNSIDLSKLVDVYDNHHTISIKLELTQNYPNSFESDTKFNVFIPVESNLKLSLRNLLGEEIAAYKDYLNAGSHSFNIDGASLVSGSYFIMASDGNSNSTIKIMKYGATNGTQAKFEYTRSQFITFLKSRELTAIQNVSVYNFIGFAKGYRNDTLKNMSPANNENIEFSLIKYTIFDIVSGDFSISNIKDSITTSNSHWDHFGIYDDGSETNTSTFNFYTDFHNDYHDFSNPMNPMLGCSPACQSCQIKKSGNTLWFCIRIGKGTSDAGGESKKTCTTTQAIVTIDTTASMVTNFSIGYYDLSYTYNYINYNGGNFKINSVGVILKDLPYSISSINQYTIEISGGELLSKLVEIASEYTTCWDSRSGENGGSTSYYHKSIIDASNATLRIRLYTP